MVHLRSGFRSPAYEYISRFFDLVGDAKVKGKLFDLGTYPAGVPANDDNLLLVNYTVSGMKKNLPGPLASLMIMKECLLNRMKFNYYRRELVDVFIDNSTTSRLDILV